MENQSFFANDNAWKIRKYVLLSGFLNFFYENGGANCKEFFAVDTFAMRDQLSNGRPRIPSLSRAARRPAKKSETTSVKLIRLLQQPNHLQAGNGTNDIADLCSRDPNLMAEAEGPLEKVFSRIMPTIGNRPAMLFIDPYGSSRLSFSSLKRVLRRKQTCTELVIKFDAEAIWRQAIELCADQCGHSLRCRAMFHKIGKVLGIDQLREVPAAGPAAALISKALE